MTPDCAPIRALLPMVTLIGLQAGTMLGGSVVVESVFALPGLGRLAYESVVQRDLNTLLGIVFVSVLSHKTPKSATEP